MAKTRPLPQPYGTITLAPFRPETLRHPDGPGLCCGQVFHYIPRFALYSSTRMQFPSVWIGLRRKSDNTYRWEDGDEETLQGLAGDTGPCVVFKGVTYDMWFPTPCSYPEKPVCQITRGAVCHCIAYQRNTS